MKNQIEKPCRLSLQEQNRIVYLYQNNNLSIQQISKQTHHQPSTVSKVLHNHGIDIGLGLRQYVPTAEEINIIKEILENHGSIKDAGKAINRDFTVIKRIIKENNLVYDYRPYNKNLQHDFFSIIDSEEKAWLLGFLFTDGSVRQVGNSKQIRLSIQLRDEEIIDKIKSWLNIDTKTLYDTRPGKECCGIEFTSSQIFDDLSNYGIIPNKTYITNTLSIEKIPKEFRRAYIRGLFDGDGIISFTGNIYEISCGFVSYFEENALEFQAYVDTALNKESHNKIHQEEHKFTCTWRGRQQVVSILSWLYDNANVYLKRKYDKYLWIKSTL